MYFYKIGMEDNIKKIKRIKENIITLVISLAVGGIIFLIYFLINQGGLGAIPAGCNAAILSTIVLVASGILVWLSRMGAFDTFAYGFKQLGSSIFGRNPTKYNNMVEYKQAKIEKRTEKTNYYLFIIFAGLIFGILTVVLEIIYHTIIGG